MLGGILSGSGNLDSPPGDRHSNFQSGSIMGSRKRSTLDHAGVHLGQDGRMDA